MIRQTLHCQEVLVGTLFRWCLRSPTTMTCLQRCANINSSKVSVRYCSEAGQQEGRAVFQHYPEEHHLNLGRCVHVEVLGLHSLLKTYSYSVTCSLMAVSPGPVGVATDFAERGPHFIV